MKKLTLAIAAGALATLAACGPQPRAREPQIIYVDDDAFEDDDDELFDIDIKKHKDKKYKRSSSYGSSAKSPGYYSPRSSYSSSSRSSYSTRSSWSSGRSSSSRRR